MPKRCYVCDKKNPEVCLHSFPKNEKLCLIWKETCGLRIDDNIANLSVCSNHFISDDYFEPCAKQITGRRGRLILKPDRYPTVKCPKKIVEKPLEVPAQELIEEPVEEPVQEFFKEPVEEPVQEFIEEPVEEPVQEFIEEPVEEIVLEFIEEPIDRVQNPLNVEPCTSISVDEPCTSLQKRKYLEPRYFGEVTSPDLATPKRAKRVMLLAKTQINILRKREAILKSRNRRLCKKVTSLKSLIKHLRQENVLSEIRQRCNHANFTRINKGYDRKKIKDK
ncbi:unnamed protein product [Phyllotreta striolata]|uniref:THAP-type domain-containing protein n=1 Tax=Phyllotreta striolata TaxID=444603 RepID=A0A9N9TFF5_PHYSR|nr:unnamed protein product [Phyllotreta striolata]